MVSMCVQNNIRQSPSFIVIIAKCELNWTELNWIYLYLTQVTKDTKTIPVHLFLICKFWAKGFILLV